jgi:hypothetical protein
VVTSDEQFGPFLAALVAERLGLPHTPLEAVLTIQHKHYARQAFQRIAPEANVRHALIRRGFEREDEVGMPFPFYVKPAKAKGAAIELQDMIVFLVPAEQGKHGIAILVDSPSRVTDNGSATGKE